MTSRGGVWYHIARKGEVSLRKERNRMGGKKKSGGHSSVPAPAPIVKAGEVTGGEDFGGGSLSVAKKKGDKKGTLAQDEMVGALAQAVVDTLGK